MISLQEKVAWSLVLLPLLVDYKGATSTAIFDIIYAAIVLLHIFGVIYFIFNYKFPRNKFALFGCVIAAAFLGTSASASFVLGHKIQDVISGIAPIFLFFSTTMCIGTMINSRASPQNFWNMTIVAASLGMVINLLLVFSLQGLNVVTARYQILGGFTPLLVALTISALVYGGLKPWTVLALALNGFLILFSVTRTQIVVALSVAGSLVLFAGTNLARAPRVWRNIGAASLVLVAFVAIAGTLPGAPLERWATRLMITDEASRRVDITAITRKAQTDYQLDMMGSQPIQALLGFGVATESGLANSGAAIIYELLGYQEATYRDDGVGHNNYIGSLFVGGAVAGSVLIAYKFFVFCLCWKCVRNFSRAPGPSTYLSVSAPLSVIAYLAFGFLGGYFGSRSASVCLAIAIGLTIWQMANSASRPIRNTLPRRTLAS